MDKKERTTKSYSKEFKVEAIARSKTVGKRKTCEELGIAPSSLHRWCHELAGHTTENTSNKPTYQDLEKEVKKLKKELGYVEEINRVLKKSTAIFSSSQIGGLK